MRLIVALLLLSGCGDIAWNTRVAETPVVRAAMMDSVVIGETTERAFVTRWGAPVQKIREGGQVDYVYRDMGDAKRGKFYNAGDSTLYVIVTFQYGKAVAVRSNDTEGCRATFAPRPPGYEWDNPTTVYPVPTCPGLMRAGANGAPQVSDDSYDPGKAS